MRVLLMLAALAAAPLTEVAAQQPASSRPGVSEARGSQRDARRDDDKKCKNAAQAAPASRDARRDDDDGRRSGSREAQRDRDDRRSRNQNARRSHDDDDDDDDDADGRSGSRRCDPTEPPPPPPAPETSEISGVVFEDRNANGVREADEPAMPSWSVMLTGPSGTQATMTDAQGTFAFGSLASGSYVLCQMQPGGFQIVPISGSACAGAAGYEFTLSAPVVQSGFDFANWM